MFRSIRAFDESLGILAGIIFVAISLLVVVDVAFRMLASPIGGVTEIGESLLVFAIALAFADTQRVEGNISIELFVDQMSGPVRRVANVANKLVCLALVVLIAYGLVKMAIRSFAMEEYQFSTLGNIPVWPAKWGLALGFVLLAIEFAFQAVEAARGHLAIHAEGDVGTNV